MRYREIMETEEHPLQHLVSLLQTHARGEKVDNPSRLVYGSRPRLTTHNMTLLSGIETGWLVHFTEHADAMMATGYRGHLDHRLIGATREWSNGKELARGYGFAFPVPSKEASYEQSRRDTTNMQSYGYNALFFKAPYVLVRHRGDKQNQAIFAAQDFHPHEVTSAISTQNMEQWNARAKLSAYWNTPISVNGVPNEKFVRMSPEELAGLERKARQPTLIWTVENGPLAGKSGSWAKVVKAITK